MTEYNYYISDTEYINKNDYNVFLKNIYNNLLFDKNMYDIPILTNTDMCNCNINSLTNIKFLTSGSNDVYIADIINSCITKSTYFNNNVKHVILKVCKGFNEDDEDELYVWFGFNTAWSAPTPIAHFLKHKFEGVRFRWFYRDETDMFCGYLDDDIGGV